MEVEFEVTLISQSNTKRQQYELVAHQVNDVSEHINEDAIIRAKDSLFLIF